MNLEAIQKLVIEKSISIDIEAGITLQIKNEAFRPGTVRVHLPAPINASWLKEGQLLDSEPMLGWPLSKTTLKGAFTITKG